MQNKGLLTTFTILFAIASLYSLSLTWFAVNVENDAKEYAETYHNGSSDAEFAYLDSMASVEVYPIIGYTYGELRAKMLNLGLDLKGGMNVTLEVQIDEVVRALSSYSDDSSFNEAIKKANELQVKNGGNFVTYFEQAYNEINPNGKLISVFYTRDNKEKLKPDASNEEVLTFINEVANAAIEQSFEVLRTRINLFGAAQPSIQRLTGSDRILVELPGVKNKERVRQLLQGTAKLEFWTTYQNNEFFPVWEEVNATLAKLLNKDESTKSESDSTEVTAKTAAPAEDNAEEVTATNNETKDESDLLSQLDNDSTKKDSSSSDLLSQLGEESGEDSLALFQKSVKENPLFAIMTIPTYTNEEGQQMFAEGAIVGIVAVKDTAKLNSYLAMPKIKEIINPRKYKLLWAYKPFDDNQQFLQLYAIKVTNRDGKADLEGDVIVDASQQFGMYNGAPEIEMLMNGEGATKWRLLTGENVGKPIAIVLDGLVYSAPAPSEEIAGGRSSITGNFTIEEAKLIANILKAGKLPAPAKIVEEAVVGPTLGQESISKGMFSFIIALLIVLAYMVFYYSKAGVASVIALLANMFFIFGILASMPQLIALTLPGIAGIILTIGMSVDANVLIFERIREEIAAGKGMRLAVADGYKFAYSSIIDANITTLLTGFVLWFFGTGPVEGFAKTLVIGILTSLFTAIFITRLIFEYQLNKGKVLKFATNLTDGLFQNTNIQFLNNRKKFYILSGIIIVIGIGSLATKGLQKGVDFQGGRTYVIRFDNAEKVETQTVSKLLEAQFDATPEVKTFGDDNQVKITTTYLIDSPDENADDLVEDKLYNGLTSVLGNEVSKEDFMDNFLMSSQKVGPTIANDMIRSSILSVIFSLIIIFLYIVFRFKKWQYGAGALIALFHDVLIVLSLFSIFYGILPFSLEIDQAFIAAILTVVGYSINDTVVVFDRIREYLGSYKKREINDVVNSAINSTLSRTVNTSLSTIFVLLMIFIWGGEVIRGFTFALLIGVIVGTYSSAFLASPIVYDFMNKQKEKKNK
ncbi:MAG TPA: protein translocase subunit SecDF [Vicingaceae bacterium]|nr:protein translocase subunit SecDF [Vicingaceae bacterium]